MAWLSFRRGRLSVDAQALHDAHELRARYGVNAEEWCEIGLLGAADPEKRRLLKRIRQALAEVPPGPAFLPAHTGNRH